MVIEKIPAGIGNHLCNSIGNVSAYALYAKDLSLLEDTKTVIIAKPWFRSS